MRCFSGGCGVVVLQALFGNLTLDVIVLTMLYSTAGLGIAIVNDFKSIEGDRCTSLMHVKFPYGNLTLLDPQERQDFKTQ